MNQNQNAFFAGMAIVLLCVAIVGIAFLIIYIFFCLSLQRTQQEVRPRNRLLPPGLVWLHLLHLGGIIPIVGVVVSIGASIWDLIMVIRLGGSLKREFEDRGWRTDGAGFGRPIGLIWAVSHLTITPIGLVFNLIGPQMADPTILLAVAVVIMALWLAGFVCKIIYWVQMVGYGRRLREGRHGGYRRGSIEEDYDDEFRGPRRWRDEEEDEGDEFEDDRRERRRRYQPVDDDDLDFEREPRRRRDDD